MKKHKLSNINVHERVANCDICGLNTAIRKHTKRNYWLCVKAQKFFPSYGPTQKWKEKMVGYCEICGSTDNLVADHDHVTNQFRGTLCKICNSAIGIFGDNLDDILQVVCYFQSRAEH